MHHVDADKVYGEKAWQQLHKNAMSWSPGGKIPQNNSCKATYHPSRKPSKLDEPHMRDIAGGVRLNSWAMYSCGPLQTEEQGLAD